MEGLDRGENHIRGVVTFQVMRNLVEGSARVRVSKDRGRDKGNRDAVGCQAGPSQAEGRGQGQGG